MAEEKEKVKKSRMPDTYVITTVIIVLMIALTWIIPAGTYDYAEDGKTVIAGTYHEVERNGQGIMDFLNSFLAGMNKTANTIFVVFMVGGAFEVLKQTGTIETLLGAIIKKTKGNYKVIVPVVMVFMAIMGMLGAGNNVALAFIPVMVILYRKMGLDSIVVMASMYFASNTGFSSSPMNPFTVLLGQSIAGLPSMSGGLARGIMCAIFTCIAIWWTLRYIKKITTDPTKSLTGIYAPDVEASDENAALGKVASEKMTWRHILCLVILFGTFAVYAYGGINLKWDMPQLGACMMAMTFLLAIAGGLGPNKTAKAFAAGAKTMTYANLLIGFAGAINVIMSNGKIIHSIIYGLSIPLSFLPTFLASIGMFIANFFFNFFVNSGSGQCYVVMPLMAPLADVLGITRQVAISAFQFGDGLSNVLVPTSGLMMGSLGMANIPYNKWLKFAVPVTGILAGAAMVFLFITTLIGWA